MKARGMIRSGSGVALVGLAAALMTGISGFRRPIVSQIEFLAFDKLVSSRDMPSPDFPLVIVRLDQETSSVQSCPSPPCATPYRKLLTETVKALGRLEPSVIGFDIYLEDRRQCKRQNRQLHEALEGLPPQTHVVFVCDKKGTFVPPSSEEALPPAIEVAWPTVAKRYDICRAIPLVKEDHSPRLRRAFALSVFLHWKRLDQKEVNAMSPTLFQVGDVRIPTLEGEFLRLSPFPEAGDSSEIGIESTGSGVDRFGPGDHLMLLNWWGTASAFKNHRLSDLKALAGGALKGKIVLVGGLDDERILTPLSEKPLDGFEVQANAIATLVAGRPIRPMRPWAGFLWAWASASMVVFVTWRRGAFWGFGILIGLGFANLFGAIALIRHDIWMYLVLPGLGAMLAYTFAVALEQERVRKVLSRFIPWPLRTGQFETFKEATVFVADIRQYTNVAERIDSSTLYNLINQHYYMVVEEALAAHRGIIVQSEGDKVIAFFAQTHQGFDHAQSAVLASIELLKRLPLLYEKWPEIKGQHFRIGIGISTGSCSVGILGHRHRDAALLGDPVNIASHLEGLTKEHGCPLILDERTSAHLGDLVPVELLGTTPTKSGDRQITYLRVAGMEALWERKDLEGHEPSLSFE